MATGLAIGLILGAIINNFGLGIPIGLAIGFFFYLIRGRRPKQDKNSGEKQ
jgi:hypothetical protein